LKSIALASTFIGFFFDHADATTQQRLDACRLVESACNRIRFGHALKSVALASTFIGFLFDHANATT
jgi:hypothetical protein